YLFKADPYGWALCTVNDVTGEINIQSDWGEWAYRWPKAPGGSLTSFIGNRSSGYHYFADKLSCEEGPQSGHAFDAEPTVNRLRTILGVAGLEQARSWIEYYGDDPDAPDVLDEPPCWADSKPYYGRNEPLCGSTARDVWDRLGQLVDCDRSHELFLERLYR